MVLTTNLEISSNVKKTFAVKELVLEMLKIIYLRNLKLESYIGLFLKNLTPSPIKFTL